MSQNGTRVYGTARQPAINVALEAAWKGARTDGVTREVWRVDLPGGGDAWYVTRNGSPADDSLPAGCAATKIVAIDKDFARERPIEMSPGMPWPML